MKEKTKMNRNGIEAERKRKKVVVVTMSTGAGSSYISDLKEVIPEDKVEYMLYTPETFPKEGYVANANVYLVSSNAIRYTTGMPHELPLGVQMVETRVAFRSRDLECISLIPEGTECLLVNTTEPLALECIVDFYSHSIFNVRLAPYWPGSREYPQVATAITAGDPALVPSYIESVYDLGFRHLSPGTVSEVLLALDMEFLMEEHAFQCYTDAFPPQQSHGEKLLKRSIQYKTITNYLMGSSDYGIIGINDEHHVFCINQNAVDLLELGDTVHTGRHYQELLPFLSLEDYADDLKNNIPVQQIIQYGDTALTVSLRVITDQGRNRGLIVRLQRFADAENRLQDARMKLLQKGHTAKYTFEDIAGSSPAIIETCRMARKMAATNSAILITGESGTGKELLASAIHNASSRSKHPYIAINCAAMPENLLESELFGYEEGAFTGARKNGKAGLFEHAHMGTIFLDEIEDMSPSLQVKLLRVLQEKEIMRVGGTKIINVDVRIIAATNINIETMVRNGQIRKDLYYRLNTMQLELPPLRSRREDIPLLVKRFRIQEGHRFRLSDAVMDRFMKHHWDGNIRELKNCLEFFQCLDKETIQPEDLPRQFLHPSFAAYAPDSDFPLAEDFASHAGAKDESNPFTEEETFVLKALYDAYCENRLVGRRTICDMAREQNIMLTEQEIRKLLKILETRELVKVGSGRAGSRLTPKAIELMQKGTI